MQKVYHRHDHRAIVMVLAFVLLNIFGHVVLHLERIEELFNDPTHLWFNVLANLCLFEMNVTRFFPCVALHYFQYGTYENLKSIKLKLDSRVPNVERECIRKFAQLAMLNHQFHNVNSFHLALFLLIQSINSMITVYVWLFFLKIHALIFFPVISIAYLLFLAHLNGKIGKKSEKIASILRKRHEVLENQSRIGRIAVIHSHQFLRFYAQTNHRHLSEEARRSCLIKLYELDIYVGYFEMRIFNIARVDKSFLLAIVLLITNYIIFIYQTKWMSTHLFSSNRTISEFKCLRKCVLWLLMEMFQISYVISQFFSVPRNLMG